MFQFPASPVVGQTFTPSAGLTFRWNGTAWYLVNSTLLTPTEADARYVQIANARSMESRIINGNFLICQRGSSIGVSAGNVYAMDRWFGHALGGGSFTMARSDYHSLVLIIGTADAALAAGDLYCAGQKIEGIQVESFQFGTADAKSFTFACDAYTEVAGIYPISFHNGAGTRSYVKTVNLAANTWTAISFTVPGDTTGVWERGNASGMEVLLGLGVGSTYLAPAADSWQAGNFVAVAGCVNAMATTAKQFWLRDARLYPGTIDYGPCQRLYADELRLCQRYYEKSYDIETVPGAITELGAVQANCFTGGLVIPIKFTVGKRAQTAITFYNSATGAVGTWRDTGTGGERTMGLWANGQSSFNANVTAGVLGNAITGHWTASAEL